MTRREIILALAPLAIGTASLAMQAVSLRAPHDDRRQPPIVIVWSGPALTLEPVKSTRLDRVRIATTRDTVEISWAERDDLLNRIRRVSSAAPIVTSFEAVGATRPVKLDREQTDLLAGLIGLWIKEARADEVPDGIVRLQSALEEELAFEQQWPGWTE